MNKILVTGASGFIGKHLCEALHRKEKAQVVALTRQKISGLSNGVQQVLYGGLNEESEFDKYLAGVDVVIHCAAKVHMMADVNSLSSYRQVNTEATLRLAKEAASKGVRRFIYLSSIKVNGEQTVAGKPFGVNDPLSPSDAYGISKAEAETGLKQIAEASRMEIVIIRPPLVYGKGVKANFSAMTNLVNKGLPLPFGAIDNRRSFISLWNLVDLIITCIEHADAANQIFLASDGEDVSTAELCRLIATAGGKRSVLFPVPVRLLQLLGKVSGKSSIIERLCSNLQVDISHTRKVLGWTPPFSLEQSLRLCLAKS